MDEEESEDKSQEKIWLLNLEIQMLKNDMKNLEGIFKQHVLET